MYLVAVAALMLVLPLLSIVIAIFAVGDSAPVGVVALRCFVFWGVGVRLLTAGLRQITRPQYTATTILGMKHRESLLVVRELGFANTALGTIGVLGILVPSWVLASAVSGAVFYGLAGVNHLRQAMRTRHQKVAMWTDLAFSGLLLILSGLVAR
jgi:hypothetical protein